MKTFIKTNLILFIAALFLLGAFGKWPYSYYQIMRWVVCCTAAYSAYNAHESSRTGWAWMFGIIAILFNPIAPFYLARYTWQILDLAAAVPFLIFPFMKHDHD